MRGAAPLQPIAQSASAVDHVSARLTIVLRLTIACLLGLSVVGDTVTLKVGQSVYYTPGFLPAQVMCDDRSIVRVDDAGSTFRLTALRAGETDCAFWSIAMKGIRRVVHVVSVK